MSFEINLAPLRELLGAAYTDGNTDGHREQSGTAPWGHTVNDGDLMAALRVALRPVLTIEPCHVTGEHDPNHTDRYLCGIQQQAVLAHLLDALGQPIQELPHALHPSGPHSQGGCGWCHNVPGQEEYREQLRKTWTWAGVPISEELAAPADDAPRPGDPDALYEALSLGVESGEKISWMLVTDVCEDAGILANDTRRSRARQALVMDCRLVESRGSSLVTYTLATPEQARQARAQRDADTELLLAAIRNAKAAGQRVDAHVLDIQVRVTREGSAAIGYERFDFAKKWMRYAGLAIYREHQGWFLP